MRGLLVSKKNTTIVTGTMNDPIRMIPGSRLLFVNTLNMARKPRKSNDAATYSRTNIHGFGQFDSTWSSGGVSPRSPVPKYSSTSSRLWFRRASDSSSPGRKPVIRSTPAKSASRAVTAWTGLREVSAACWI